jgi:hypothetical protein
MYEHAECCFTVGEHWHSDLVTNCWLLKCRGCFSCWTVGGAPDYHVWWCTPQYCNCKPAVLRIITNFAGSLDTYRSGALPQTLCYRCEYCIRCMCLIGACTSCVPPSPSAVGCTDLYAECKNQSERSCLRSTVVNGPWSRLHPTVHTAWCNWHKTRLLITMWKACTCRFAFAICKVTCNLSSVFRASPAGSRTASAVDASYTANTKGKEGQVYHCYAIASGFSGCTPLPPYPDSVDQERRRYSASHLMKAC